MTASYRCEMISEAAKSREARISPCIRCYPELFALIVLPFKETVRGQEYQIARVKLEAGRGIGFGNGEQYQMGARAHSSS